MFFAFLMRNCLFLQKKKANCPLFNYLAAFFKASLVASMIALEEVPAAIVKQNKADVDTVSGATLTSNAIITATKDALKKAAK